VSPPGGGGGGSGRPVKRRYPIGAEPVGTSAGVAGGTHLRVWAPGCRRVVVRHGANLAATVPLDAEPGGYFSGLVRALGAGGRYGFVLDDDEKVYPDPASRFQPEGPHRPSEVVDPTVFAWGDTDWRGSGARGQVIYELHVGTFTAAGTYAAATERLATLRALGVTLIELMPLNEFPGRFGWGYDGVDLWAPTHLYGRPDDLRRFVDGAHRLGMGVILDVVYNHIGPDGNYLARFSADYFTDRYPNEWGAALNFDGPGAGPTREFFIENAAYWIDEFHFDGLRLDATQQINDSSPEHVLAAIARRVRAAAGGRMTYLVAENEPQETKLVRPAERGGYGLDALWNDDFHHSAVVALTGHNEAYFSDHLGSPQELISALRWGFLFQGQRYAWQKKRRGTPALDLPAPSFVLYLENHDQIANTGSGARLGALTAPGDLRALTALLLLAPGTPMLFQGQEFGSTRPFLYFADHDPKLGALVAQGRRKFLSQFPSLATADSQQRLPDPTAEATFRACQLDWGERDRHDGLWQLHRDLLALRRDDPVFQQQDASRVHGVPLGPRSLLLRIFGGSLGENGQDRLLVVSLGGDQHLSPAPEPLLAPPEGHGWRVAWSSEDLRYGGRGTPVLEIEGDDCNAGWHLPGHCAVVLVPYET
jgi:maltooligosyltrehalose trehalohydrolase